MISARANKVGAMHFPGGGLSAHADKDCLPDKSTLSASADNMGFSDRLGLLERNALHL